MMCLVLSGFLLSIGSFPYLEISWISQKKNKKQKTTSPSLSKKKKKKDSTDNQLNR